LTGGIIYSTCSEIGIDLIELAAMGKICLPAIIYALQGSFTTKSKFMFPLEKSLLLFQPTRESHFLQKCS